MCFSVLRLISSVAVVAMGLSPCLLVPQVAFGQTGIGFLVSKENGSIFCPGIEVTFGPESILIVVGQSTGSQQIYGSCPPVGPGTYPEYRVLWLHNQGGGEEMFLHLVAPGSELRPGTRITNIVFVDNNCSCVWAGAGDYNAANWLGDAD